MKRPFSLLRSSGVMSSPLTDEVIACEGYEVQVLRTKRTKTLSISITKGRVVLRAPKFVDLVQIMAVLDKRHEWILANLALQAEQPQAKQFVDGEKFSYLGREYPLCVIKGKPAAVKLALGAFMLSLPANNMTPPSVRRALFQWYKEQAKTHILARIAHYEPLIGVKASEVRFKYLKRRWGSCDTHHCLDFNWLLIQAPWHIIDYVVVHELTHIAYFSHSGAFWAEVARHMPDYAECEQWLRHNGAALLL